MKKSLLTLAIVMAMFSCTHEEDVAIQEVQEQQELLSREQINQKIKTSIQNTGDFLWREQNANTILSALKLSDDLLTIGYGASKNQLAKSVQSNTIKDDLISFVKSNEPKSAAKGTKTVYIDETINYIDIKVTNKETIKALLKDSRVRYIEPAAYEFSDNSEGMARDESSSSSSSSGCGYDSMALASQDYRTVSPGARVPWAFDRHNIPSAWNHSTGAGVTLAVIDTGLSPEQKWMNEYFNDGFSSGRSVQKYGTFVDSWWAWSNNYDGVNDKCGHGTSMAAVATAPRNNDNLPVGVAYNANLVTYRAVENVVIDDYHEKRGISEALTALANRSDVKVISMSIGWPFSIGKVEDAIKYAYNRGKMIIAAGGTSTSFTNGFGVIFPATMSETVAVTGVKDNQSTTECDECHKGSKIDFTVQMQRASGRYVPVLSYYNGQSDYIGGSSVATAMTAGIAALVWSKHPTWTRAQVLAKMKQSAEFYPNKHADFGYGNINALQAVQ